ncbi:putative disease resistance RPP13-like protein 1 [Argentina anserina]|uniref:putative disease resistance RPP13-like protein 1 n=1 Tax=Argentina anserina TaxID=57926 RepID=UPI0021765D5A|nr:putative disease resistance RPP13-like protein 1 [Potentilla anserina]
MALEVVGEAFLSSALAVLFHRMASRPVVDFIQGKKNTTELLYKLKMKLLSVNKWLDDAGERLITDPRVREWLDELKDVLYHTDDLLDDIKSEALCCKLEQEDAGSSSKKSQVLKYFRSFSVNEFEKSLETRILEILNRLELIVNEKEVLNLKEGVKGRTHARLPTTSLVEESSVYGRNEEKEAIIKFLLADDVSGNKTDVLPIVGMGGMGKTTLAQLVYNNDRVEKHFDHHSWVCVLEGFDITKITQSIFRSVSSEAWDMTDLDILQRKLKTSLAGKKFLIVLDDVWTVTDMEWDLFSQPFASGAIGSKIIVTTRIEGVASTIGTLQSQHLLQLSEESCWMVFSKYAFKNANPSLEVIGKQIAQKCKGVPLAAKSLGSLLRCEPSIEKWKEILASGIWELKEKDILPALWLSYHYLPPHLKRCFAYCSIFPQDYEIRKPKLILLWMAEDLLPLKSKTAVEEVGDQYFDELVSRSFLQPGYDDSIFLMHDLIHDLANFVSGEFTVRWEGDDSVLESVGKTRHFSCLTGSFDQWDSLYEAKYLRTLISSWYKRSRYKHPISPDLDSLFLKLQCLRMLNLNGDGIVELPSSIGKLKHLRHFDLSFTEIKKLPDEICTLYNLQTLLLWCCKSLIELPTELGRLVNLRHLDIQYANIKQMPTRMGKMKDLRTLRGEFVLDKHTGGNIVEIKELQQLRGTLWISGLRNIMHVPDALEANLRNKKHLEELVLDWGGRSGEADDTQ